MSGRRVFAYLAAAVAGIAAGSVSALAMAGLLPGTDGLRSGMVAVEGWESDFAIGSSAADPYTRARVAKRGLLALARSEAVYFVTARDSQGRPLTEACDYRISGGAMPARWWSITLYDADSRLPANDGSAMSVDRTKAGDGNWTAFVSRDRPADGTWISSRNAGDFDLTLRLYVPDERLFEQPREVLDPPRVERVACADEG